MAAVAPAAETDVAPQEETIVVEVGQSKLIAAPWPVKRVSVTEPKVADVEGIAPQRVLVLGKKIGTTDLLLWGEQEQTWHAKIDVRVELERIRKELAQLFPKARLDVAQSQEVVIITGFLPTEDQAARLQAFLKASEGATGLKYANLAEWPGAGVTAAPGSAQRGAEPEMIDLRRLQTEINELFPDCNLEVRRSQDVIVVKGMLRRAEDATQLDTFLKALDAAAQSRATARKELADQPKFVNMTTLAGVQQVSIQVRVAEVSRTALRAFGIQALQTGHHDNGFFGYSQVGPASGGALSPITIGPPENLPAGVEIATPTVSPFTFNADVNVSPLTTLVLGFPRAELQFFVQALAENLYLRILAEPNLVALSGEEASFLAGGELPVPVVQGTIGGAAAGTAISVEWKEFGVRLQFRPTVLGDNTIRLHVAPEVSDLSDQNAVEIQGFRIPSIVTRRAETTLELNSGQTFLMAGLLNRRNEGRNSRVPGLGDVPIIGALFRSSRYLEGETELAVLVTAWLVEPLSLESSPPLPGDFHTVPNDWEFFAMGKIEGSAPPTLSEAEAKWLKDIGLGELRGPGAWATYDKGPQPSRASAAPAPSGSVQTQ